MARIFITGSTDGIGLLAARRLIASGHEVYLHARSSQRASETRSALPRPPADILIGDFSSLSSTRALAASANAHAPFDAIVHNAGIGFSTGVTTRTADGLPTIFQVNVVAPYVLVALMQRPTKRMLFMSSGMHRSADTSLTDLAWRQREIDAMQAYCDSKFCDVLLAKALARRWEGVEVVSMEPGWVKTKTGGDAAPGDSELPGRRLAEWAEGKFGAGKTGVHINCEGFKEPVGEAEDEELQERLMKFCAEVGGVEEL